MMNSKFIRRMIIALLGLLLIAGIGGFLTSVQASEPSVSVVEQYRQYYLPSNTAAPTRGAIRVTYYGTTMFLLDDGETKLLFDAFITRPSGEISLRALQGEPLIQTDSALLDAWLARPEVGRPAAIFAAHSHHDHAMDIPYVAEKTGAQVYGSASTLNVARGGGIPETQLSLYDLGKPVSFGKFTVTVLPGRHALNPDPLPDDRGRLILEPLRQPAKLLDYAEGGAFDFLIQHGNRRVLIKGHTYIPEVLNGIRADVMLLSVSPLAAGDLQSPEVFYAETVGKVQPKLVVPTHWDLFVLPLSDRLVALNEQDLQTSFDFISQRLTTDGIQFGIMQGYQSILLFGEDGLGG